MKFVALLAFIGAVLGSLTIAGGDGNSLIWMLTSLMWLVTVVCTLVKA